MTRLGESQLVGEQAIAIGHGNTVTNGDSFPSAELLEVALPVESDASCRGVYGYDYNGATMLCSGYVDGTDSGTEKDSCQGDSGGPLLYDNGGVWEQIGVVSWGDGCATTYGVYSDVKELRSWIVNKMNENPWRSSGGGGALGLWSLLLSLPLAMVRCRRIGASVAMLIAVFTLAGCSTTPQGAGEPEVLFNPEVKAEGLEFSVVSHGCTEDDHLFLRVEGNSLTLLRTQKDRCRTAPQLLRFVMPLPVSDNVWQIENPVRYSNRVGLSGAQPQ